MQKLMETIKQFEEWSGIRVNLSKTVVMMLVKNNEHVQVKYKGHETQRTKDEQVIRYLGFWGNRKGNMDVSKELVKKEELESKEDIKIHSLTPDHIIEIFLSKGTGLFRYSATLVDWMLSELQELEKNWVQTYRVAWHLPE